MNRCHEIEKLLGPFADGELSPVENETVGAHLEGCVACQTALAGLKGVREHVAALPRVRAPEKLLAGVAARLAAPSPCSEEKLSAFLDDALAANERQATGEHLASCRACAEALVGLDEVAGRVRALPRVRAPDHFLESVVAALDSPWRRRRPPAEPFTLGKTATRVLAAASVLVLALGSLAFATPNKSARSTVEGMAEPFVIGHAPVQEPRGDDDGDRGVQRRPPESALVLYADALDGVPAKIEKVSQAAGFAAALEGANAWAITGAPEAVRQITKEFQVEDLALLDAVAPPPLDHVTTRGGAVFVGRIERETPTEVVVCSSVANDAVPDLASVAPGNGLLAEYHEMPGTPPDVNTGFQSVAGKAPVLARVEPVIDVSTSAFALARTENVAIRWSGYLAAERAGAYTFELSSDDGARLELDGNAVCGADGNHGFQASTAVTQLGRGLHRLAVLYFNGGGPGACRLRLAEPGGQLALAPTRLLHDPASVERARAVLSLTLSMRSVVKVEHAGHDPVTIHVVVKKRSE